MSINPKFCTAVTSNSMEHMGIEIVPCNNEKNIKNFRFKSSLSNLFIPLVRFSHILT